MKLVFIEKIRFCFLLQLVGQSMSQVKVMANMVSWYITKTGSSRMPAHRSAGVILLRPIFHFAKTIPQASGMSLIYFLFEMLHPEIPRTLSWSGW